MDNLPEKYRPKTIDELKGQKNAELVYDLSTEYVAPSYLFFGPPGTGKTSMAKLLIAKIENNSSVISEKMLSEIIEVNCGLNGNVDDIKEVITSKCQMPPRILTRKYVIFDEAQMLSASAQNALLNIMEIPPPYLTFILCTTEQRKLIQAVKSRCLQVKFVPGESQQIMERLQEICRIEKIKHDDESLEIIAQLSNGSFREALMILSQYLAVGATIDNVGKFTGSVTRQFIVDLVKSCFKKDHADSIARVNEVLKSNIRIEEALKRMLDLFTELVVCKLKDEQHADTELQQLTSKVSLIKICDIINESIKTLAPSTPENLHFQLTVFKIISLAKNTV